MFSKLRPHHRRTPSNPTSPADQLHSFEPPAHADHAHPQRYQDANISEPGSRPPPLPPQSIARVSSAEGSFEGSRRGGFERDPRIQHVDSRDTGTRGWETYGFSNHQRLPYAGSQRPESAGNVNAVPGNNTSPQYTRQQGGMNMDTSRSRPPEISPGYLTSPEFQGNGQVRKPASSSAFSSSTPTLVEPLQSREGRSRLNLLKNPMSLLARRRTSQAVEKLAPQSLVSQRHGQHFNESFDPRIRGTVVHDFTTPRGPPKRIASAQDIRPEASSGNNLRFQRSPNGDISSADENVTSPWSGGNHTPVFTENFEEEQYPNAGPHVRKASDLTDLPLPQPPYAKGAQKPLDPNSNASAKSNEGGAQKQVQGRENGLSTALQKPVPEIPQMPDHPPPVPPKTDEPISIAPQRISIDPAATPPKAASSRKGRSRNVSEVSLKDGAIPKHMKSTSSRFSFDMIGAAKQERLLEDRHRQKALEKKAKGEDGDEGEDEFGDNYDYDDMDEDDGLEERIPGVNADLEEDDYLYEDLEEPIPEVGDDYEEPIPGTEDDFEEPIPGTEDDFEEPIPGADADDTYHVPQHIGNLGGFTFQQSSQPTPMSPHSPEVVSTPRDADGEVIGFAMTKNSPGLRQPVDFTSPSSLDMNSLGTENQGLGLGINTNQPVSRFMQKSPLSNSIDDFSGPVLDDDDLYFDDGLIGGPGDGDDVEFDESVFDNIDTDEYGRPLKSLSSLPTLYSPPMVTADPSPSFNKAINSSRHSKDISDASTIPIGGLAPQPSISGHGHNHTSIGPPPPPLQTLTQDTLAAYQQALASAAFAAAANGKFRRDSINPSEQEYADADTDAQPGLIPDSSHTSHSLYEPFSPSYDHPDEADDSFDYDDVLEDDPIIAAANAEALANDDDGFYGQEFGFYSAPGSSNETEFGGYFGPRGATGINRGPSNRVVSREPNLTPITERSEYSNRNSFMSLGMYGGSNANANANNVMSPGLAQLTSMLRSPMDYEGDMSFDALLKLRRGAWGGSQASLHSSNGGSPRSAVAGTGAGEDGSPGSAGVGGSSMPPWTQGQGAVMNPGVGMNGNGNGNSNQNYAQQGQGQPHRRKNSTFSLHSEGGASASAASSPPASPTMTMSFSPLGSPLEGIQEKDGDSHPQPNPHSQPHPPNQTQTQNQWQGQNENGGEGRERKGSFGTGTGTATGIGKERRHRKTNSAESISYMRDEGERWILERRRTGEGGEVDVERVVVRGGI